jgi:HicA toxin of bacterial toxin-antitoxin,
VSRHEKLLERFLRLPKDFTYDELKKCLASMGYDETKKGKTSGSWVAFVNQESKHIIRLHKPHPGNIVKSYVLEQIYEELKNKGII